MHQTHSYKNKLLTGVINLFNIYEFVATHPTLVSGKNGDMGEYTKLVKKTMTSVPNDMPGWYLWGRFNEVGFWETVYLGKAGNIKTSSLRARIQEELLDERTAFWATVYGTEPTERQHQKIYNNKYSGSRAYRKRNVHFIVWVSIGSISEAEVKAEETVLISAFRPAINIQRGTYPAPTQYTDKVVRAIDDQINQLISKN